MRSYIGISLILMCMGTGTTAGDLSMQKQQYVDSTIADTKSGKAGSDSWPTYTELLSPYIDKADWIPARAKQNPQLRQELNAFLAYMTSFAYFTNVYQDSTYPDFWPIFSSAFPLGFNNPDDSYFIAPIDDEGVYRISGYRGTVSIFQFEIGTALMQVWGTGGWASNSDGWSPPSASYALEDGDANINDDGSFEVVLSQTRPKDYEGDWWKMEQDSKYILVRQRAYDWLNETDGRIAIDRLDVPAMRPRRSPEDIDRRLKNMAITLYNWTHKMADWVDTLERDGFINKFRMAGASSRKEGGPGAVNQQLYPHAIFDIKPDEALILEADIPACKYWMVHLCDEMMSSIDQINRQTSINGHQAHMDSDGKFRSVISLEDPEVPNWLDTGGRGYGVISSRFWKCSDVPALELRKVKIAELRRHLPADTPVVTAEQREVSIRLRRKGAQLRGRW